MSSKILYGMLGVSVVVAAAAAAAIPVYSARIIARIIASI